MLASPRAWCRAPGHSPTYKQTCKHFGWAVQGLEAELVDLLAAEQGVASTAHTLLYLSCGFQSFRRDVKALTAGGAWRVAHLQAFSFFPGTNHLESLAVLQRTTAHT